MLLDKAKRVAASIILQVNSAGYDARVVGSIRRGEPRVTDIDILVTVPASELNSGAGALNGFCPRGARPGVNGPRRRAFILTTAGETINVDIFTATPTEMPYALIHYTGGKAYNIRIRAHAKKKGWLLNQYGLFDKSSGIRLPMARTESGVQKQLGITPRPPEDRRDATKR